MKTKNIFFFMLFAFLIAWSCDKDDNPDPPIPSKLEQRQFNSDALANNAAGNLTMRNMMVYTPPEYDPNENREYPVIYILHGLPFSDSTYIAKEKWDSWISSEGVFKTYPDFPEEGFQKWVDKLIEDGKMDPTILVMPNSESAPYGFCFYTNSALNGNFEDFIAEDLLYFIDTNYKTIANKEGRAVLGHSQGGYGAFKLGMKHPDKFGAVAAHSAPLFFQAFQASIPGILVENPDGMNGPHPAKFLTSSIYAMAPAWSPNLSNPPFMVDLPFEYPSGDIVESTFNRWLENDPFTMLNTYGANFKSLKGIYFDCGNLDEFGFWQAYDFFRQGLDAHGISYTDEIYDGGHFDKTFSRLEVSLEFCSNALKQ